MNKETQSRIITEVYSVANPMMVDDETDPFIRVVKDEEHGHYTVITNGVARHTPCSPEDVIRALSHYLQSEISARIKAENAATR